MIVLAPPTVQAAEESVAALRKRIRDLEAEVASLRGNARTTTDPTEGKGTAPVSPAHEHEGEAIGGNPTARALLGRLMLRQSVFDEKTIAEPAQFTYVRPASADEQWSVDIGLGLQLFGLHNAWSLTEIFLGAEYHRDTAASSLAEQFLTGFIAKSFVGEPGDAFGFNLDTRAMFKTDNVADIQAISGAMDLYPRFPWLLVDNLYGIGPMRARWQPFAGLFYDEITDTGANSVKGHRLVGRYGAQLLIYPLWGVPSLLGEDKIETSLELAATYTGWSTLNSNGLFDADRSSRFFTARLTYNFKAPKAEKPVFRSTLEKRALVEQSEDLEIGLSLIYENGEDPQLGLSDIDQLTLSLSSRF